MSAEDSFEVVARRVLAATVKQPQPCVVCDSTRVVSVALFIPNERIEKALGVPKDKLRIVGYWACNKHVPATSEAALEIERVFIDRFRKQAGGQNEN